jgi:hypothetical protein
MLAGVSCSSATACTAVGDDSPAGGGIVTLAERWNGSSWSIQPIPSLPGATSLLTDVSCPSAGACTAVGYSVSGPTVAALVEQWDGAAWTIVPTPTPRFATWVELTGVSCLTPNDCTAVGGSIGRSVDAQEKPLAEHWNGSGWAIETTPNLRAENGSNLVDVSCVATVACEAVGDFAYADTDELVFAYGWNGTGWVHQHEPNPTGNFSNSDFGVSCASSTACTSVGSWVDTAGRTRGLADGYDGAGWSHEFVPDPVGFETSELRGVACRAGLACVAVGDWSSSPDGIPLSPLAEAWDGSTWRIERTPKPDASSSSLQGVDCPPAGGCVAVGSTEAGGVTRTLVEVRTP